VSAVRFDLTPAEHKLVNAIVVRACSLLSDIDRLTLAMDITAVHANGCPLQLEEMLKGDTFDFVHDIDGIQRHIDRHTGQLKDFFEPRFAKPQGGERTNDGLPRHITDPVSGVDVEIGDLEDITPPPRGRRK
jgi:hypothetical protein